jgi:hypothetical protein
LARDCQSVKGLYSQWGGAGLVPQAEPAQGVVQGLRGATARRVPRPQDDAWPMAERLQERQGVPQEGVLQALRVEWVLPPGRKAQQQVSPLLEPEAWWLVLSGPLALLAEPEAPVQLVLQWG